MTNQDLQKFLQRFPQTAPVRIKLAKDGKTVNVEGVEMGFDHKPLRLEAQNLGWSEMIQDKIEVLLVPDEQVDHTYDIVRPGPVPRDIVRGGGDT